jgi:hypothetical protein
MNTISREKIKNGQTKHRSLADRCKKKTNNNDEK